MSLIIIFWMHLTQTCISFLMHLINLNSLCIIKKTNSKLRIDIKKFIFYKLCELNSNVRYHLRRKSKYSLKPFNPSKKLEDLIWKLRYNRTSSLGFKLKEDGCRSRLVWSIINFEFAFIHNYFRITRKKGKEKKKKKEWM